MRSPVMPTYEVLKGGPSIFELRKKLSRSEIREVIADSCRRTAPLSMSFKADPVNQEVAP